MKAYMLVEYLNFDSPTILGFFSTEALAKKKCKEAEEQFEQACIESYKSLADDEQFTAIYANFEEYYDGEKANYDLVIDEIEIEE